MRSLRTLRGGPSYLWKRKPPQFFTRRLPVAVGLQRLPRCASLAKQRFIFLTFPRQCGLI